ncbi:MAG TPA: M23 family metallopeptidase [Solimonas sp.]|nr:M23 family metallopeptidase [Solimonas sp.]
MGRLLIFLAGALLGAACVYYLFPAPPAENVTERLPAPVALCPPAPEPIAPPACPPPAPAEVTPEPTPAPAPAVPPPAPAAGAATPIVQEATAPEPPAEPTTQPGRLLVPVAGIAPAKLSDTFTDSRSGGRVHDAIDIMAPRGTKVIAVDDGRVVKLFKSVPGGLTVYQFDPGEQFSYYYAHLDAYAPGLVEGQLLKRGDLVGYVGSSGNASATAPHLHFAIARLGPEKRWWEGTAVNPFPLLTGR